MARIDRNVAACALPRPSATASAKFANNTVSHSHTATARMNPGLPSLRISPSAAPIPMIVVRMLPMNTTNITGLRICTRGSSLRKDSQIAERRICPVTNGAFGRGASPSTGVNPGMGFA